MEQLKQQVRSELLQLTNRLAVRGVEVEGIVNAILEGHERGLSRAVTEDDIVKQAIASQAYTRTYAAKINLKL